MSGGWWRGLWQAIGTSRSPGREHRNGPRRAPWVGVLLAWLLSGPIETQGEPFRAAYDRAVQRVERYKGLVGRLHLVPRWLPADPRDGKTIGTARDAERPVRFWYRIEAGSGRVEYWLVDATAGTRAPAFDGERIAAGLNEALKTSDAKSARKPLAAGSLDLDDLEVDGQNRLVRFRHQGAFWRVTAEGGVLREEPGATAPADSLETPPQDRARAGSTEIRFVNRTGGPVELIWLAPDGKRTSYGTIEAGTERSQQTYVGHEWQVVGPRGAVLTTCEGLDEATVIEVGGSQSPDGVWVASVREHNLFVTRVASGEETRLTTDGTAEDGYRGEVHWSPDSSRVVAIRVRAGDRREVTVVESSPEDQVQPRTVRYDYFKPGDRLPHPRPRLFEVATGRAIPIDETLFANPFTESGMLPVRWQGDSSEFCFSYNERGHQRFRIVGVSATTGAARAIVEEQPETFFCYSQKQFQRFIETERTDAAGRSVRVATELIWMSERDGWNHLWLVDVATGRVKNQITRGEWVVRSVDHVDEAARTIWFFAGGVRAGEDPYHQHLCRVGFDGSGFQRLTEGDGSHRVDWSPDRTLFVDTWSRADLPPVHELRRADGSLVMELERADAAPLLATGWRLPERFVAKGRDGVTDIHGLIYRAPQWKAGRKAPVLEYIYAGPHGAFVPKEFRPVSDGDVQMLVELGFVVVRCDGMGTNHRSKAFHDVCWKNLGDSGFPDRIAWIRAAAARYPELDLERVGIYGGSAGGQSSTRALLAHGEFYKAAVSDCGCHDNRMDKIWWNEQWMGWPVGPHYAEQSNVTQAHRLQGKLLLVVGELDRNVDPASTLQVANALIRADKDFELLVMTGVGHGSAERPYGRRRRAEFFVRHLQPEGLEAVR
jgi:dipeptidyl-peptidase-4